MSAWLTKSETAAYLRVSEPQLDAWLAAAILQVDGRLPDGTPRFKEANLDCFLAGKDEPSAKPKGETSGEATADADLLTTAEVADRLRLAHSSVYRVIRQIPHAKIGEGERGGRILVRRRDLEDWIEARTTQQPAARPRRRTCRNESRRAGGRRAASGTRASATRSRGSASSDPRVAELERWLKNG